MKVYNMSGRFIAKLGGTAEVSAFVLLRIKAFLFIT